MTAKKQSFSKKEAISYGWNTTLKNFTFFIGITVVMGLIQIAPNLLESILKDQSVLVGLLNIVISIVSIGITLGSIKIYLSFIDKKVPEFSDLLSLFEIKIMWRYFLTSLIYGLAVLFGFILLIVPGIYIAIKYGFYTYILVDKRVGVFEALAMSGEITRGRIWELFVFHLLLGLIVIAGMLALVLGLFVALPTTSLATAYVYRKLESSSKVK